MNDADKIMHYEELIRRIVVHGIPNDRVRQTIRHYNSMHPDLLGEHTWKELLDE